MINSGGKLARVTITMSPIFRDLIAELMVGHGNLDVIADLDTRDALDEQLRALAPDGSWSAAWPAGQQAIALPRAVEAQIVFANGERVTRLFSLR